MRWSWNPSLSLKTRPHCSVWQPEPAALGYWPGCLPSQHTYLTFLHLWPFGLPSYLAFKSEPITGAYLWQFFRFWFFASSLDFVSILLQQDWQEGSGVMMMMAEPIPSPWQEGSLCTSDLEFKLPRRKNREWGSSVKGWDASIIFSVFWEVIKCQTYSESLKLTQKSAF